MRDLNALEEVLCSMELVPLTDEDNRVDGVTKPPMAVCRVEFAYLKQRGILKDRALYMVRHGTDLALVTRMAVEAKKSKKKAKKGAAIEPEEPLAPVWSRCDVGYLQFHNTQSPKPAYFEAFGCALDDGSVGTKERFEAKDEDLDAEDEPEDTEAVISKHKGKKEASWTTPEEDAGYHQWLARMRASGIDPKTKSAVKMHGH